MCLSSVYLHYKFFMEVLQDSHMLHSRKYLRLTKTVCCLRVHAFIIICFHFPSLFNDIIEADNRRFVIIVLLEFLNLSHLSSV